MIRVIKGWLPAVVLVAGILLFGTAVALAIVGSCDCDYAAEVQKAKRARP